MSTDTSPLFDFALLDVATTDLAASKTLYDAKLFPQAIFFLQQSAEKAQKFSMQRGFGLDLHQLKKYSHKTAKLIRISEERSFPIAQHWQEDPFAVSRFVQQMSLETDERSKVNMALEVLEEIARGKEDMEVGDLEKIISQIAQVDFLKNLYKGVESMEDIDDEYLGHIAISIQQIFKGNPEALGKSATAVQHYNVLSALLNAYVASTRYPAMEGDNPVLIFDQSHPIIESFPKLANPLSAHLENTRAYAIFQTEEILKYFSSLNDEAE